MRLKRKRLFGLLVLGLLCVTCVLILILLQRHPPEREAAAPPPEKDVTRPRSAEQKISASPAPQGNVVAEARRSFGVLVWPGMTGRAMNYSRQILSWTKEWGFECGFVTVQGTVDTEGKPSALPADIQDGAWKLSEVSSKHNALVVANGDLSASQAVPLNEYVVSGGWLIMPSPEDGGASAEAEELLQLKPSRSATLMAPEEQQRDSPLGAEEVRVLVSHPVASGFDVGSWLEWTGPAGEALYSKTDEALPLLCFRRPELPAMRLIPFGQGGVVHWNFGLRPGPLIEEMEVKAFLGQTVTWLWGRASWAKPVEKEGTVPGIVRKEDGAPIPAAKVTAKVFSESGEAAQTLEATSSEDGKFTLSLFHNAIYWVKADAEGYYQADMYLLARPQAKKGEQIEVLMEPEGAIFGHAYYGPGEDHPAVGISVTLAPNCRISSAWEKETVTDGNARFSFDHLPAAQTFYLTGKAEGWMGIQEAVLPLHGSRLQLDIHLEPPFLLKGSATNAATAEPLATVEILAQPDQTDGSRFLFLDALTQRGASSEEGRFTLMLPVGRWRVTGEALRFTMVPPGGHPAYIRVTVLPNGEGKPSDVAMEFCPHAALYGTVFRSSGEAAPKAKVAVYPGVECWTDEQGRYRSDRVPPSGIGWSDEAPSVDFRITAECLEETGMAACSYRFVKEGDPPPSDPYRSFTDLVRGDAPLDVHLRAVEAPEPEVGGAAITGIVLTERGEPSPFAKVELAQPLGLPQSHYLWADPRKKAISDSEGKFAFSQVREGLWLIRATKKARDEEGGIRLLWGETWQTVVEGMPVPTLEIRLRKAYIQGELVEADGSAVRNRHVTFSVTLHTGCEEHHRLFLEEDGEFSLLPYNNSVLTRAPSTVAYKKAVAKQSKAWPGVPEEDVTVPWERGDLPPVGSVRLSVAVGWAQPEARAVDVGEVPWGTESLRIALPAEGTVKGRLVDADTGSPIANAYVGLSQQDLAINSCETDDQGMFSFSNAPAGRCALGTYQDGYWWRRKEIDVVEEAETYVQMELWTYWTIRGRLLLKETGEPILAEIQTPDGAYVSARNGRFAVQVPARKGERYSNYWFSVPFEKTGLKSIYKEVGHNPWALREVDVGDIYVEREEEAGEKGSEQ